MNSKTQKIVQLFLKHLSERNLEEITKVFSEKVDWFIPGDHTKAPWIGARKTRKEILIFFEMLWENTEPISANIDKILIDEDTAIISGDFTTKMSQTNKIVNSLFFIQITVRDNQICRYRLLEDSFAVSKSLTL